MSVGLDMHDVEFWFRFDLSEEDLAEKFPHIENWIVRHILENRKDLMNDINSGEVTMPNAYWLELANYYFTYVCPWEADAIVIILGLTLAEKETPPQNVFSVITFNPT